VESSSTHHKREREQAGHSTRRHLSAGPQRRPRSLRRGQESARDSELRRASEEAHRGAESAANSRRSAAANEASSRQICGVTDVTATPEPIGFESPLHSEPA
jgi:hypothetical protein